MLAVGRDHTLQLRQVSLLGSQIERCYIEKRGFDRDHEQVRATYHPRTHLVPQRELLRYFGSLIDPCLDLERPVGEPLLGGLVAERLPVLRCGATRGEPRDHVAAAG